MTWYVTSYVTWYVTFQDEEYDAISDEELAMLEDESGLADIFRSVNSPPFFQGFKANYWWKMYRISKVIMFISKVI